MGRRKNHLKAAKSLHEEEGDEINKEERSQLKATTNSLTVISSDDEEGNEDLSLKIVEKALLRACTSGQRTDADSQEPERGAESTGVVSVSLLSSEGGEDVAADMKSKKKIKKEKKKIEKVVVLEEAVVAIKDEENADIIKAIESVETIENVETNPVEKSDNIVLRKLLRGPRYFDPPDSGWGTCYNCGEEGHTTVNCTSAKRRRPCFICGSLEHNAKQCVKGQDCFICKKGGHRAKDCPEKYKGASKISKICLRCGDAGHDMFSCKNNYSAEDLKEIQCYICQCFGHLCCADFTDTSTRELSCYRCGQLGHGGLECRKSHRERASVESVSSCFKCGEGGHFARECPNSTKDCRKSHGQRSSVGSVSSCFKCGEGGHFARECPISTKVRKRNLELATPTHAKANLEVSTPTHAKRNIELSTPTQNISKENTKSKRVRSVPSDIGKAQKRKKAQSQEGQFATSSSSKKRGGWITEDPGDLSSGKAKVWGLKSPVTPANKKKNIYTSGVGVHASVSRSSTNTHIRHFRDPPSHGAPHSYGSPYSYRSPHSHGPPLSYAPHPSYAPPPSYASYGTPPPSYASYGTPPSCGTPPSYRAPSAYRAPPPPFFQHRYSGTRFVNFR